MIEKPKKEAKIKNHAKAITVFGVIQIVCGIIALAIFITRIYTGDYSFIVDYVSYRFSYSSGYGNSSHSSNKGDNQNYRIQYRNKFVADVLIVMFAWTMLISGTAYIVFACVFHIRPSMQSKLRESGRLIHYNSSQLDLTNHQDLQNSPIQLDSTNININQLEEPPTYQEVSGL